MTRFIFFTLIVMIIGGTNAFLVPSRTPRQGGVGQQNYGIGGVSSLSPVCSQNAVTVLAAKKKEEEKIQVTDPLELLLLYMTPWKNPNSIFVYMIIILFLLGKYSEANN